MIYIRYALCFLPLLALWGPDATRATTANAYRRFWVACFDAIRGDHPESITPELASFERLMWVLAARADGELPAWEGLRVVRERRL